MLSIASVSVIGSLLCNGIILSKIEMSILNLGCIPLAGSYISRSNAKSTLAPNSRRGEIAIDSGHVLFGMKYYTGILLELIPGMKIHPGQQHSAFIQF